MMTKIKMTAGVLSVMFTSSLAGGDGVRPDGNGAQLVYARILDESDGLVSFLPVAVAVWSDGLCYRRCVGGDPLVGYLDDSAMNGVTKEILRISAAVDAEHWKTIGMPGEKMQKIRLLGSRDEIWLAWNLDLEGICQGGASKDTNPALQFVQTWFDTLAMEFGCVPRDTLPKEVGMSELNSRSVVWNGGFK